jgi:hypothetical protein
MARQSEQENPSIHSTTSFLGRPNVNDIFCATEQLKQHPLSKKDAAVVGVVSCPQATPNTSEDASIASHRA